MSFESDMIKMAAIESKPEPTCPRCLGAKRVPAPLNDESTDDCPTCQWFGALDTKEAPGSLLDRITKEHNAQIFEGVCPDKFHNSDRVHHNEGKENLADKVYKLEQDCLFDNYMDLRTAKSRLIRILS